MLRVRSETLFFRVVKALTLSLFLCSISVAMYLYLYGLKSDFFSTALKAFMEPILPYLASFVRYSWGNFRFICIISTLSSFLLFLILLTSL